MSYAEIADTQKTLAVLADEIQNLIQHLKAQTENYTSTIQNYNALVSDFLKHKDQVICELECANEN